MTNASKIALLLILLAMAPSCSRDAASPADVPIPMTFNGTSEELKATEVVATLDTAIPKGKNVIWCASFQSAWKAIEGLAGEPISLNGEPQIAKSLNVAADVRPHIPEACLYVAAGWSQKGITEQIDKELRQKFPDKKLPTFSGITPDSFVAYSYIEAKLRFSISYNQNTEPFTFTNGNGTKTEINSFGIRTKDRFTCYKLRAQPRILFIKRETRDSLEFAIDLCSDSSPSQIVIARIPCEQTLAATLAQVEMEVAEMKERLTREPTEMAVNMQSIGPSDVLLIPDFHWFVSHRFSELEGGVFANQKLSGQRLNVAQEDIFFRLDKNGVELKSEAKLYYTAGGNKFTLDRPFLIYMKKRGAEMPYFAMWVDNAELLRPWQGAAQPSPPGTAMEQTTKDRK